MSSVPTIWKTRSPLVVSYAAPSSVRSTGV
jgi:hypothetical protein